MHSRIKENAVDADQKSLINHSGFIIFKNFDFEDSDYLLVCMY